MHMQHSSFRHFYLELDIPDSQHMGCWNDMDFDSFLGCIPNLMDSLCQHDILGWLVEQLKNEHKLRIKVSIIFKRLTYIQCSKHGHLLWVELRICKLLYDFLLGNMHPVHKPVHCIVRYTPQFLDCIFQLYCSHHLVDIQHLHISLQDSLAFQMDSNKYQYDLQICRGPEFHKIYIDRDHDTLVFYILLNMGSHHLLSTHLEQGWNSII